MATLGGNTGWQHWVVCVYKVLSPVVESVCASQNVSPRTVYCYYHNAVNFLFVCLFFVCLFVCFLVLQ